MIDLTKLPQRWAPTRGRNSWTRWGSALFGLGLLALAAPAYAFQLVTDEEAAKPNRNPVPFFQDGLSGGVTRRPAIELVSPPNNGSVVKSPLNLKVKLTAFGGTKIDKESIVVTYEKAPDGIDLTQRLVPFITAYGIEVPDAAIPPGTHKFRITVKGTDGHPAGLDFTILVGK